MLKHFEISKPQVSFYEQNEQSTCQADRYAERRRDVALVSNAGTPGVSDPGFTLVRAALEEGIAVTAVPGPSALIMALVLSGLPVHAFTFRGFPPRKSGARRNFLAVDQASPHTLVFYESPYRLVDFLKDALTVYGDRPAAVANDLTKKFEASRAARFRAESSVLARRRNCGGVHGSDWGEG
jgi:16S rRNA (cytidine1402-2'-O)-methyltransferase